MHGSVFHRAAFITFLLLMLGFLMTPSTVFSQQDAMTPMPSQNNLTPMSPDMVDSLLGTYEQVLAASQAALDQMNKSFSIFSTLTIAVFTLAVGSGAVSIIGSKSAVEKMNEGSLSAVKTMNEGVITALTRITEAVLIMKQTAEISSNATKGALDQANGIVKIMEDAVNTFDNTNSVIHANLKELENLRKRYEEFIQEFDSERARIESQQTQMKNNLSNLQRDTTYNSNELRNYLFKSELWQRTAALYSDEPERSLEAARAFRNLLNREPADERYQTADALSKWAERTEMIHERTFREVLEALERQKEEEDEQAVLIEIRRAENIIRSRCNGPV